MTEVGDAYIRIHADTRFLRNELRREARAAGTEAGEETGDAFSKTLEKTVRAEVQKTRQALARALVVEDFKDFQRQFGSIRKTVARVRSEIRALERDQLITARDADKVRAALADWRVKAEVRERVEATRLAVVDLEKEIRATIKTTDQMSDAAARDWRRHALLVKDVDTAVKRAYISLSQGVDTFSRDTVKRLTEAGEQAGRGFAEGLRRHVDERGTARIFGRVARSISHSFRRIPLLGPLLAAPFKVAQVAAGLLEKGLGTLVGLVSSGGSVFGKFAGTVLAAIGPVAGLVIGLGILTVGLGVLAAAASLAAGAIVALASSLITLAGGALLIAGPLLLALAAAITTVVIGIKNMTEAQKDAFGPITRWYDAIKKPVAEHLFSDLEFQVGKLGPVLERANPLLLGMADAIREVGNEFVIMLGGKGFQEFQRVMSVRLPSIMTHLGNAFVSLTSALVGIFTIAAPYADRFAAWLDGVMVKFDTWVHSAEGKNSIREFLDRAERAGKAFLGVLEGIWDVFEDLVNEGSDTGTGMFEGLADSLETLDKWLESPEGRDALKQWFEDAKDFAEDLADALGDVGDFLDKLDDPETRKNLNLLLQVFEGMAVAATTLVAPLLLVAWAINQVDEKVRGAKKAIEDFNFGDFAAKIGEGISGAASAVGGFFSGLGSTIGGFFAGLWGTVSGAVSSFGSQVISFFSQLPGRILAALQALPGLLLGFLAGLPALFIGTVTGIVTTFAGLAGKIITAAGDLAALFVQWAIGVPTGMIITVQNVVVAWIGLAGKIITAAGSLINSFIAWVAPLPAQMLSTVARVSAAWIGLAGRMISAAGDLAGRFAGWVASLPGKSRATASSLVSSFLGLAGRMISAAGSLLSAFGTWVAGLGGVARSAVSAILSAFSGLADRIISAAGDVVGAMTSALAGLGGAAADAASAVVSAFSGLGRRIADAIGSINIPRPNIPDIPGLPDPFQRGGIVWGRTHALLGEAGPEAVIPLYRSLSQIDPSVRAMAALLRGLNIPQMQRGGIAGGGITLAPGAIQIVTPTQNPALVAAMVFDRFVQAAR